MRRGKVLVRRQFSPGLLARLCARQLMSNSCLRGLPLRVRWFLSVVSSFAFPALHRKMPTHLPPFVRFSTLCHCFVPPRSARVIWVAPCNTSAAVSGPAASLMWRVQIKGFAAFRLDRNQ